MKLTIRVVVILVLCFIFVTFVLWFNEVLYNVKTHQECRRKDLKDYILVIAFSLPYYKNNIFFQEIYQNAFGKVVICGPEPDARSGRNKPDIEFDDAKDYGYYCMGLAVRKYQQFKGYFYINDEILFNWWNIQHLDFSQPWQPGHPEWSQKAYDSLDPNTFSFKRWKKSLESCRNFHQAVVRFSKFTNKDFDGKKASKTYLQNGHGQAMCGYGWSNFFYIPHTQAASFSMLTEIGYTNRLKSDIGLHNILRSLSPIENLQTVNITTSKRNSEKRRIEGTKRAQNFWMLYNLKIHVAHPFSINSKSHEETQYHVTKLKSIYLDHALKMTNCKTLD